MDHLDAALHWLLAHDPQRALYESDEDYARAAGITMPKAENRQRRHEVEFSDVESLPQPHCRGCADSTYAREHTAP